MFLIKQGRHSVVCQLDLKGFNRELAVLSGRASSVSLMRHLIATHGEKPDQWLPPFYEAVGEFSVSKKDADESARTSGGAA